MLLVGEKKSQILICSYIMVQVFQKHIISSSSLEFFVIHLLEGPLDTTITALLLFDRILAAMSLVSCDFGWRVSLLFLLPHNTALLPLQKPAEMTSRCCGGGLKKKNYMNLLDCALLCHQACLLWRTDSTIRMHEELGTIFGHYDLSLLPQFH